MPSTDELPLDGYVAADRQFNQEQTEFREATSDTLWNIAKKTNRYIVCGHGLGVFALLDGRRLLDGLQQWQDVLPFDEDDFEALRTHQSDGSTLNEADQEILIWLTEIASAYDGEPEELHYAELWQAATILKGTEPELKRFLLAKLY